MIDNMVWTDSWLSIVGTGCGLTGFGVGEDEDHVWFEDQWMVASLCDK
jgi:hypothetical protein